MRVVARVENLAERMVDLKAKRRRRIEEKHVLLEGKS